MSSNSSIEGAYQAGIDVVAGLAKAIVDLLGRDAAARMLAVSEEAVDVWINDGNETAIRKAATNTLLPSRISELAEYAWGGTFRGSEGDLDDLLTEAVVVVPLLQGGPADLVDVHCQGVIPPQSIRLVNAVVDAATARRTLDSKSYGDLTVAMLASLAKVSEKTIRMAANPKNDAPLRTTKVGASTFILSDDALDWLGRRPDFRPTAYNANSVTTIAITGMESLASALRTARSWQGLNVTEVVSRLKWTAEKSGAYQQLEQNDFAPSRLALVPDDFLQLAKLFKIEGSAEFAKQAYRTMVNGFADAMLAVQLDGKAT